MTASPLAQGVTVAVPEDDHEMEAMLTRIATEGNAVVRVVLDWAACQPEEETVDAAVVDRYRRLLKAAAAQKLEPLLVLSRANEPVWLGSEFWLRLQAPELFAKWADAAAHAFAPYCTRWTTLDNPNGLALQTWLMGTRPPRRKLDVAATVRALDHMLAAHVLAYDTIHEIQPEAIVGINLFALSAYEVSPLMLDILCARELGVPRAELRPWLDGRRHRWYRAVGSGGRRERVLRRIARSAIQLEMAFPRAAGAVYLSDRDRLLDVVQVDYHEPAVGRYILPPGRRHSGTRRWLPLGERAEVRADITDLARYLGLMHRDGRDVWLVQNVDSPHDAPRLAVETARADGVPVTMICGPVR